MHYSPSRCFTKIRFIASFTHNAINHITTSISDLKLMWYFTFPLFSVALLVSGLKVFYISGIFTSEISCSNQTSI